MALAFSASNRYVYSGDASAVIFKYDMTLSATDPRNPQYHCEQYRQHSVLSFVPQCSQLLIPAHQDMVRGISPHPYQDEVFLSAR
jgi:DDB1- and CUL4-associated factor 5